jgi:putative tricarboxylic transport membrane protein
LFVAVYAAASYELGSALRMGPGYFPTAIGGIVAVLGLLLALSSLRVKGPPLPRLHLRPIAFIVVASIGYGYLLKPLGLVLATALLVLASAAGGHEFRWREALVLAIVLALFSVLVFIYALGLPFPLWPEALD